MADRDEIFDYIAVDNPLAALTVDERIEAATLRLIDHPQSGRPGRVAGTRELVVQRAPYILAYRIEGDTVRVLRVLHGAQLWPDQTTRGLGRWDSTFRNSLFVSAKRRQESTRCSTIPPP